DGNRGNGRPLRRVLGRVLKHHPYGALTHLRRKLTGRLVILHGSNLSRSGASDKPGAVHIVEASIAKRERDRAPARKRSGPSHSNAMFLGLVDSLRNVVDSLRSEVQHTDWSRYATSHSYNSGDF